MQEIWKPVKGFDGCYVSNFGRVKRDAYSYTQKNRWGTETTIHKRARMLPISRDHYGYMQVHLCRGNTSKVHRLVAMAFIPNPYNLPQVNHKDEDMANNCAANLEWCSNTYNNNYGTKNERQGRTKGSPYAQYILDGKFVAAYYSSGDAERHTGIFQIAIREVASGKLIKNKHGNYHPRKTAGGYIWKKITKEEYESLKSPNNNCV